MSDAAPRVLMACKGGGWGTAEPSGLVNGSQRWNHPTMWFYMDFIGFRTWRNTRQENP